MNLFQDWVRSESRRQFLARGVNVVGSAALATLLGGRAFGAEKPAGTKTGIGAALPETHHLAKAKNIIYLHMVGGPAQMDLYDYKPKMAEWFDKDLPDTVRMGQRLTTMTSGQARFPIAPSKFKFRQHGE